MACHEVMADIHAKLDTFGLMFTNKSPPALEVKIWLIVHIKSDSTTGWFAHEKWLISWLIVFGHVITILNQNVWEKNNFFGQCH